MPLRLPLLLTVVLCGHVARLPADDPIRDLQTAAIQNGRSDVAHWGFDPDRYTQWTSHSLRLIPVYTFGTAGAGGGIELKSYTGAHSPYRDAEALRRLYGYLPENTLNPSAEYCDQTNIADIQFAALQAGRKYIFLVIFDGMDWQTTQAAAIYTSNSVAYTSGRGSGLHFLDYTAKGTTEYGFMVTAPHNDGTDVDVDRQVVLNPGGTMRSGYNARKAGPNPWTCGEDDRYIIGSPDNEYGEHAYPDSANTATAMTSRVRTYNNAINVDPAGTQLPTIAHVAQERGYAVGAVSSVPMTHATPAAAYAHNVSRNDYQDIARDMLGQPSVSHPDAPLPGLDVVIGGGYGVIDKGPRSKSQGANFIPGLSYIASETIQLADVNSGGKYTVAVRTPGVDGAVQLQAAAEKAVERGTRLLGLYGVGEYGGHLPYGTADGDYRPAPGNKGIAEEYTAADLTENPTLAEMTSAALTVLQHHETGFWLMVEAGDVDWANHDNNLDTSIGAVQSGDAAVKVITDWVEQHSDWQESVLIVTADHGHYLNLLQPQALTTAPAE